MLRSISNGLFRCLFLRAHYYYPTSGKAIHDRLRGAQPPVAGPQEALIESATLPAGRVLPKSDGTRLIAEVLHRGHSAGSGLWLERSHASNLCPHSSHLYSYIGM